MDTSGYQQARSPTAQSLPKVRVEVPQYWVPADNSLAVQFNNEVQRPVYNHQNPILPAEPPRVANASTTPSKAVGVQYQNQSSVARQTVAEDGSLPEPLDQSLLLLGLAEEYLEAAYGKDVPGHPAQQEPDLHTFRKLIATGLVCLETVLKNWRLQPALEASVRLCYASIVFEETENLMEAEECLSKGISLCEQYRLLDMKYNLQHLLVRVTSKTNLKAATKFVDSVIRDAEAEQHIPWVYALRFLRSSLGLQSGQSQEVHGAINQLRHIAGLANKRGDAAVSATAATTEAMAHLIHTNAPESTENAQTAIAAARGSQLDLTAIGVHQLTVMGQMIDLCSLLFRDEMESAHRLMDDFIISVDSMFKVDTWTSSGIFLVPLSAQSANLSPPIASDDGVISRDEDQRIGLRLSWLPRESILALGYLVCAAASMQRNPLDGQAEEFLKAAANYTGAARKSAAPSKPSETRTCVLQCHVQISLVFALCGRSAWSIAKEEFERLKTMAEALPLESNETIYLYTRYLDGVIHQGIGDTETALEIFSNSAFTLKAFKKSNVSTVQRSLSVLAALNVALIIHVLGHPRRAELAELISSLEPIAQQSQSINIRTAFRFARAVLHDSQPEAGSALLKTKENLSQALKDAKRSANAQLLCFTLNFMADKFFRGVVSGQSVKSARSAVHFARRGKNDLWTSVANGLLAEVYETQGQSEDAVQVRKEALDHAAQLPTAMQRKEEVPDSQDTLGSQVVM